MRAFAAVAAAAVFPLDDVVDAVAVVAVVVPVFVVVSLALVVESTSSLKPRLPPHLHTHHRIMR